MLYQMKIYPCTPYTPKRGAFSSRDLGVADRESRESARESNHKSGFAVVFTGWIINSQLFFLKLRSIGKEIRFMVIRLPVNSVRRILLLLF